MYCNVLHAKVELKDRMTFHFVIVFVIDLKLYVVQSHLCKPSPVIAYCHTLPHRSPSDSALKLECGAEWDCEKAAVGTVLILA